MLFFCFDSNRWCRFRRSCKHCEKARKRYICEKVHIYGHPKRIQHPNPWTSASTSHPHPKSCIHMHPHPHPCGLYFKLSKKNDQNPTLLSGASKKRPKKYSLLLKKNHLSWCHGSRSRLLSILKFWINLHKIQNWIFWALLFPVTVFLRLYFSTACSVAYFCFLDFR